MWCEVCSAATICSRRLMGVSTSSYLLDSAPLVFLSFPRGHFRRKATGTVVLSNLQSLGFTTGQMLREGDHANKSYIHGLNMLHMEIEVAAISAGRSYLLQLLPENRDFPAKDRRRNPSTVFCVCLRASF